MKILFLSLKFPHSEVAGGYRIIYQRIRYLKEAGHQIGLVSFFDNEKESEIDSVHSLVDGLHLVPAPRRGIWKRIFHDYLMFLNRPAVFWKYYSHEMMKTVGDVVEQEQYDVVIAEFSEMGQYIYKNPYLSAIRKIISCHRCVTASYEKYQSMDEIRLRLHYKTIPQMHILRNYEFNMYRSVDHVVVLTPQDRFTMQYYAQDVAISIAPAGVDMEYICSGGECKKEEWILMTGYMSDPANEDGAKWFIHHVWPELRKNHPHLKFYIVGAAPTKVIRRLAKKDERIIITGEVPDLRSYRCAASVFVSPVRLGSGLRIKVLEAMAGNLPVVSTSLGLEGLDAQTGFNCLIADTPEMFVNSVEWLLTDGELRDRLAKNARQMVEEKYTLEIGMRRFEKIIKSVVEV